MSNTNNRVIREWTRETADTPEARAALTEFDLAKHTDAVAVIESDGLSGEFREFHTLSYGTVHTVLGNWLVRWSNGVPSASLTRLTYTVEIDPLPDFAADPRTCIELTREQIEHPDFVVLANRELVWFDGDGDLGSMETLPMLHRYGFRRAYLLRIDTPEEE